MNIYLARVKRVAGLPLSTPRFIRYQGVVELVTIFPKNPAHLCPCGHFVPSLARKKPRQYHISACCDCSFLGGAYDAGALGFRCPPVAMLGHQLVIADFDNAAQRRRVRAMTPEKRLRWLQSGDVLVSALDAAGFSHRCRACGLAVFLPGGVSDKSADIAQGARGFRGPHQPVSRYGRRARIREGG